MKLEQVLCAPTFFHNAVVDSNESAENRLVVVRILFDLRAYVVEYLLGLVPHLEGPLEV